MNNQLTKQPDCQTDNEFLNAAKEFITPHIALTYFKFRTKGTSILKSLKLDLTIDQFIALKALSAADGITQQELALMLYKDKSNFSRMIDALEKKGYLTRTSDIKTNRLVKLVYITDKGKKIAEKFSAVAKEINDFAVIGISPKELETIKSVMKKMRENLDRNFEGLV